MYIVSNRITIINFVILPYLRVSNIDSLFFDSVLYMINNNSPLTGSLHRFTGSSLREVLILVSSPCEWSTVPSSSLSLYKVM